MTSRRGRSKDRPSSSKNPSRKKEYAFWAVFLFFIFGVGWIRGYRPEIDWESVLGKEKPLLILVPQNSWLTAESVRFLSEKIKRDLRLEPIDDFEEFEARLVPLDSPSLVWLPASWAEAFEEQDLLADFDRLNEEIREKVSPDFVSIETVKPHFLPLLWAVEKQTLRVEGFATPHGGTDRSGAIKALRALLSTEQALRFVRESAAASTLRSLDEEDLPLEKKSRTLRDLGLRGLKR